MAAPLPERVGFARRARGTEGLPSLALPDLSLIAQMWPMALGGVVLLGTLQGILVAIVVSVAALAYQVSDPPLYVMRRKPNTNIFRPASSEHKDDEFFPGMLILRPEGRIFFANAGNIGLKLRQIIDAEQPKIVVLDLGGVFDIEYTALRMMNDADIRLDHAGVLLWMVGLNPGVLEMVKRSPLGERLGSARLFNNLDEMITEYQRLRGDPTHAAARMPADIHR